MIEIMNLRYYKVTEHCDVRVDRSSPLGNKYDMEDYDGNRGLVCDLYKDWFEKTLKCPRESPKFNKAFNTELGRLELIYKKYDKIRLFCWCAPKRCHAETIKEYILMTQ